MSVETEFILQDIRANLNDLHTIYTRDQMTIDREYYDAINAVLNKAEAELEKAAEEHQKRKFQRHGWIDNKTL